MKTLSVYLYPDKCLLLMNPDKLLDLKKIVFFCSFSGWWLYQQVQSLKEKLSQALPVRVITGSNQTYNYIYLPDSVFGVIGTHTNETLMTFVRIN